MISTAAAQNLERLGVLWWRRSPALRARLVGVEFDAAMRALTRSIEVALFSPSKLVRGSPLKIEGLDATMRCVTFNPRRIRVWSAGPRRRVRRA